MATLSQPIIVTDTYFAGRDEARSVETGINAILNDFYEATLSELPKPEAALARHFIEEGLIVNGRRAGVTEGVEKVQFHIEETLLKKLLDSRLVRAENTHLGKSYEVSHDAMVAPIMESYEKRKAHERQEKEAREKAEQRRKLRRATSLSVAGFLLAAVAVVGLVIAIQQTRIAKQEKEKAEAAVKKFELEEQQRKKLEAQQLIDEAKAYRTAGYIELFEATLDSALVRDTTPATKKMVENLKKSLQ